MAEINSQTLLKMLKTAPSRVYFIYGKSVNDIEKCVNAIKKRTVSTDDELFNLHTFSEKDFSVSDFTAACQALPVFAENSLVIIHDLNTEKLLSDEIKEITATIQNLSDTNVVVFYFTGYDVCDGKKSPQNKAKKIADICAKIGSVCVCNPKTTLELAKDIEKYIKSIGGSIENADAQFLAQICGNDSLIIKNECDKLIAYDTVITRENIDLLTPQQLDSTIYELARSVQNLNANEALKIVENLFAMRIEPAAIIYQLSSTMMDLYRAKLAQTHAKTSQDIIVDFAYPPIFKFRVDNAFRDIYRFDITKLRNCIKVLSEADLQLKSEICDAAVLVETSIIRMMKTV
ncbi:MAG: DNA polymerase III subunit delta [Ruminococcus sp.]|jgi:DNA polymerase-3 subunit delta|nr:DNA polymerase III subunit delta [Ruminococcus sp.]